MSEKLFLSLNLSKPRIRADDAYFEGEIYTLRKTLVYDSLLGKNSEQHHRIKKLRRLGLKHLVQVSLTSKEWRIQTRRLGREVIKREAGKGLHLFNTPDSLLQFSSLDSYWSTVFANFAWHFATSTTSISSVFSAAGLPDFFSLYYAASTFLPPYHTAGYLRFIAVFFSCYTFLAVAYLMWYLDKTRTYFLWLFYNIDCIQWRTRRGGAAAPSA